MIEKWRPLARAHNYAEAKSIMLTQISDVTNIHLPSKAVVNLVFTKNRALSFDRI